MLISLARERSRWNWAFAIFVTLLVVLAIVMLRNTYKLRDRDSWVTHSNKVLRELEALTSQSSRLLIQARQRLFNPERPARREDIGEVQLTDLASQIQVLVADNAEQTRIAKKLLEHTKELQAALVVIKDAPLESSLEGMNSVIERPDNLLSQVIAKVSEMRVSEEKILQSRTNDSQSIYFTSIVSQLVTAIFAISAAFTFLYLAQRRYREQVKMSEERVRQEEQYQFLMNSASEGLCGVDQQGNCTLINRAGAELLGYTVDALVGTNFHSKVHAIKVDGTDYPHRECPIHVAIKTGKRCRIDDEVFWHRLGHPIQIEYSAAPWMQHGVATGAVVSFRDVSLRKQAERRVIEAQIAAEEAMKSAESANNAKSNFLASMSHELRTPLNAVIMYSEMLQEEAVDLDIAHFVKDLNRIHTAGRHLLSLVNGVLDIAKIEAGKMELHIETVPIQSTIADVTDTIRSLVAKNNNRLVVHATVEGTMRLDVTKFRQILFNLLSNAAKFTQDGTITLSVNVTEQGTAQEALLIMVGDTGIVC